MKPMFKLLWILLVSLLVVAEDGEADDYAILYLRPSYSEGSFTNINRLNTNYRAVDGEDKGDLDNPPDPTKKWVFWDASSVSFKMGFPSSDFSSFAPMTKCYTECHRLLG